MLSVEEKTGEEGGRERRGKEEEGQKVKEEGKGRRGGRKEGRMGWKKGR